MQYFFLVSICYLAGSPGPIETITRVKLDLYTGMTDTMEQVGFDGQTVTISAETRFDTSKPIKMVIHGWHQAGLTNGEVVVDNDDYPRSFNQLYMSNGLDYTVLGVHWVPIEGWNDDLQTASSSDAANTLGLLLYSLNRFKRNILREMGKQFILFLGTITF